MSNFFGCVLVRDEAGRYLMLDCINKEPSWRFPGGKIENGETSRDTAVRELQEEVGLILKHPPVHIYSGWVNVDGKDWYGHCWFAMASWCKGELRNLEPSKHRQCGWYFRSEIEQLSSSFEKEAVRAYEDR